MYITNEFLVRTSFVYVKMNKKNIERIVQELRLMRFLFYEHFVLEISSFLISVRSPLLNFRWIVSVIRDICMYPSFVVGFYFSNVDFLCIFFSNLFTFIRQRDNDGNS